MQTVDLQFCKQHFILPGQITSILRKEKTINYMTRKASYICSEVTYHLKWKTRGSTFFQIKSVTKRSMEV